MENTIEFLKLTVQAGRVQGQQAPQTSDAKIESEPVSIHEINKQQPKSNVSESAAQKMEKLENAKQALETDDLDSEIEQGNSVIAASLNNYTEKNNELYNLNLTLINSEEKVTILTETLADTLNSLSELMNSEEGEVSDEEIQQATQKFMDIQEEYTIAVEDQKETEKNITEKTNEKNTLQEELKSYIDILKSEQESAQGEDEQTAQEMRSMIDSIEEEINNSNTKNETSSKEQAEKIQEQQTKQINIQNSKGIIINNDGSITQQNKDGSTRTFTIQNNEAGQKVVFFEDKNTEFSQNNSSEKSNKEENNEQNNEQYPSNSDEKLENGITLEEIEAYS